MKRKASAKGKSPLVRLVFINRATGATHFGKWGAEAEKHHSVVNQYNSQRPQKFDVYIQDDIPPPPDSQTHPPRPGYQGYARVYTFGKGKNKVKEYVHVELKDLTRFELERIAEGVRDGLRHVWKFKGKPKGAYGPMKKFLQNLLKKLASERKYAYGKVTARDVWNICKELPVRARDGWTFGYKQATNESCNPVRFARFSNILSELGGLSDLGGQKKWAISRNSEPVKAQ
jgi:hypothetical protein